MPMTVSEKDGTREPALDGRDKADVVAPVLLDQIDVDLAREVRLECASDFHPRRLVAASLPLGLPVCWSNGHGDRLLISLLTLALYILEAIC